MLPRWCTVLALLATSVACTAQSELDDGPYVFIRKDGKTEAVWTEGGKRKSRVFAKGAPVELPRFAKLLGTKLAIREREPRDPAIWPLPEKLLAISDVEGSYDLMVPFLRANGVIDEAGNWSFGKGHLVTVGDMVARGSKVTEVLWLLYRLHAQAKEHGGHVHFILGNHEVMIMGGDTRYIAPKYAIVSRVLGTPYEKLYGDDTVLGRWLRARNVAERIGDWLFVHAGLAPEVELSIDELNEKLRAVIGIHPARIEDAKTLALSWGPRGPLWYRGYFEPYAKAYPKDFGPVPTTDQLDAILARTKSKRIVVGHTKVPRIAGTFGGRVVPIDTPWVDAKVVRGLRLHEGKVSAVDITGKAAPVPGLSAAKK